MKTQTLQPTTPITTKGDLPSGELVLIIQKLQRALVDVQKKVGIDP